MWTRHALEQTAWAKDFRRDAPVSYATAITFALEDRLPVFVGVVASHGQPTLHAI